jgi:hypothetical protein
VSGEDVIKALKEVAAKLDISEPNPDYRRGRIEVAGPTSEQYHKILDLGFFSRHGDIGLSSPPEVRRFLLNLDELVLRTTVMPYLEEAGFKEHQVRVEKVD